MIHIVEFETDTSHLIFGDVQHEVTIRIKCDNEGLNEIKERVYGIKSPSRSMNEAVRKYVLSDIKEMLNAVYGVKCFPTVKRILISGMCTIVFWLDGTKTIVRCQAGTKPNVYDAFTAALAKKIYGSNSQIKKIIGRNTQIQKKAGEKDA